MSYDIDYIYTLLWSSFNLNVAYATYGSSRYNGFESMSFMLFGYLLSVDLTPK